MLPAPPPLILLSRLPSTSFPPPPPHVLPRMCNAIMTEVVRGEKFAREVTVH
jgi:hypothetical protein